MPAWIDTLLGVNDELKSRYNKGLAWLDTAMTSRGAAGFVTATAPQQAELLDLIAYQKNRSPDARSGHRLLHPGAADDGRRLLHEPRSACATSILAAHPEPRLLCRQRRWSMC